MQINILAELFQNKIHEEDASEIISNILKDSANPLYNPYIHNGHINIKAILGMDEYEYTAYGHGASLTTIAEWRYLGWPKVCAISGKPIDYKAFHWTVIENEGSDQLVLLDEL